MGRRAVQKKMMLKGGFPRMAINQVRMVNVSQNQTHHNSPLRIPFIHSFIHHINSSSA